MQKDTGAGRQGRLLITGVVWGNLYQEFIFAYDLKLLCRTCACMKGLMLVEGL